MADAAAVAAEGGAAAVAKKLTPKELRLLERAKQVRGRAARRRRRADHAPLI